MTPEQAAEFLNLAEMTAGVVCFFLAMLGVLAFRSGRRV